MIEEEVLNGKYTEEWLAEIRGCLESLSGTDAEPSGLVSWVFSPESLRIVSINEPEYSSDDSPYGDIVVKLEVVRTALGEGGFTEERTALTAVIPFSNEGTLYLEEVDFLNQLTP